MAKYRIELDDEQMAVLIRALDLYSRIGLGQLREILSWEFEWNKKAGLVQRLGFICGT